MIDEKNREHELLTIIDFVESIFMSQNTDVLLDKSTEFLVQKFNLSNCAIKIGELKKRYYKNQQTNNVYEKIEEVIQQLIQDLKTPIVINSLKNDVVTKNIKDVDKVAQKIVALPIIINRELKGTLYLYSENNIEQDLQTTTMIAEKLEKAINTIQKLELAQQNSITDPLTGLYNRTYMQEYLEKTINRSEKTKQPTALIMCDIDNFKILNDTKGHIEGDKILKQAAEIIKKNFRLKDVCSRYGGEEFVIILPETDSKTSLERAEQLLEKIRNECQLTLSIGLITCLNSTMNANELIKKADEAMYKAKNNGKNKIINYVSIDKNLGIIDTNLANSMGK